jgi:hypothetical protein
VQQSAIQPGRRHQMRRLGANLTKISGMIGIALNFDQAGVT